MSSPPDKQKVELTPVQSVRIPSQVTYTSVLRGSGDPRLVVSPGAEARHGLRSTRSLLSGNVLTEHGSTPTTQVDPSARAPPPSSRTGPRNVPPLERSGVLSSRTQRHISRRQRDRRWKVGLPPEVVQTDGRSSDVEESTTDSSLSPKEPVMAAQLPGVIVSPPSAGSANPLSAARKPSAVHVEGPDARGRSDAHQSRHTESLDGLSTDGDPWAAILPPRITPEVPPSSTAGSGISTNAAATAVAGSGGPLKRVVFSRRAGGGVSSRVELARSPASGSEPSGRAGVSGVAVPGGAWARPRQLLSPNLSQDADAATVKRDSSDGGLKGSEGVDDANTEGGGGGGGNSVSHPPSPGSRTATTPTDPGDSQGLKPASDGNNAESVVPEMPIGGGSGSAGDSRTVVDTDQATNASFPAQQLSPEDQPARPAAAPDSVQIHFAQGSDGFYGADSDGSDDGSGDTEESTDAEPSGDSHTHAAATSHGGSGSEVTDRSEGPASHSSERKQMVVAFAEGAQSRQGSGRATPSHSTAHSAEEDGDSDESSLGDELGMLRQHQDRRHKRALTMASPGRQQVRFAGARSPLEARRYELRKGAQLLGALCEVRLRCVLRNLPSQQWCRQHRQHLERWIWMRTGRSVSECDRTFVDLDAEKGEKSDGRAASSRKPRSPTAVVVDDSDQKSAGGKGTGAGGGGDGGGGVLQRAWGLLRSWFCRSRPAELRAREGLGAENSFRYEGSDQEPSSDEEQQTFLSERGLLKRLPLPQPEDTSFSAQGRIPGPPALREALDESAGKNDPFSAGKQHAVHMNLMDKYPAATLPDFVLHSQADPVGCSSGLATVARLLGQVRRSAGLITLDDLQQEGGEEAEVDPAGAPLVFRFTLPYDASDPLSYGRDLLLSVHEDIMSLGGGKSVQDAGPHNFLGCVQLSLPMLLCAQGSLRAGSGLRWHAQKCFLSNAREPWLQAALRYYGTHLLVESCVVVRESSRSAAPVLRPPLLAPQHALLLKLLRPLVAGGSFRFFPSLPTELGRGQSGFAAGGGRGGVGWATVRLVAEARDGWVLYFWFQDPCGTHLGSALPQGTALVADAQDEKGGFAPDGGDEAGGPSCVERVGPWSPSLQLTGPVSPDRTLALASSMCLDARGGPCRDPMDVWVSASHRAANQHFGLQPGPAPTARVLPAGSAVAALQEDQKSASADTRDHSVGQWSRGIAVVGRDPCAPVRFLNRRAASARDVEDNMVAASEDVIGTVQYRAVASANRYHCLRRIPLHSVSAVMGLDELQRCGPDAQQEQMSTASTGAPRTQAQLSRTLGGWPSAFVRPIEGALFQHNAASRMGENDPKLAAARRRAATGASDSENVPAEVDAMVDGLLLRGFSVLSGGLSLHLQAKSALHRACWIYALRRLISLQSVGLTDRSTSHSMRHAVQLASADVHTDADVSGKAGGDVDGLPELDAVMVVGGASGADKTVPGASAGSTTAAKPHLAWAAPRIERRLGTLWPRAAMESGCEAVSLRAVQAYGEALRRAVDEGRAGDHAALTLPDFVRLSSLSAGFIGEADIPRFCSPFSVKWKGADLRTVRSLQRWLRRGSPAAHKYWRRYVDSQRWQAALVGVQRYARPWHPHKLSSLPLCPVPPQFLHGQDMMTVLAGSLPLPVVQLPLLPGEGSGKPEWYSLRTSKTATATTTHADRVSGKPSRTGTSHQREPSRSASWHEVDIGVPGAFRATGDFPSWFCCDLALGARGSLAPKGRSRRALRYALATQAVLGLRPVWRAVPLPRGEPRTQPTGPSVAPTSVVKSTQLAVSLVPGRDLSRSSQLPPSKTTGGADGGVGGWATHGVVLGILPRGLNLQYPLRLLLPHPKAAALPLVPRQELDRAASLPFRSFIFFGKVLSAPGSAGVFARLQSPLSIPLRGVGAASLYQTSAQGTGHLDRLNLVPVRPHGFAAKNDQGVQGQESWTTVAFYGAEGHKVELRGQDHDGTESSSSRLQLPVSALIFLHWRDELVARRRAAETEGHPSAEDDEWDGTGRESTVSLDGFAYPSACAPWLRMPTQLYPGTRPEEVPAAQWAEWKRRLAGSALGPGNMRWLCGPALLQPDSGWADPGGAPRGSKDDPTVPQDRVGLSGDDANLLRRLAMETGRELRQDAAAAAEADISTDQEGLDASSGSAAGERSASSSLERKSEDAPQTIGGGSVSEALHRQIWRDVPVKVCRPCRLTDALFRSAQNRLQLPSEGEQTESNAVLESSPLKPYGMAVFIFQQNNLVSGTEVLTAKQVAAAQQHVSPMCAFAKPLRWRYVYSRPETLKVAVYAHVQGARAVIAQVRVSSETLARHCGKTLRIPLSMPGKPHLSRVLQQRGTFLELAVPRVAPWDSILAEHRATAEQRRVGQLREGRRKRRQQWMSSKQLDAPSRSKLMALLRLQQHQSLLREATEAEAGTLGVRAAVPSPWSDSEELSGSSEHSESDGSSTGSDSDPASSAGTESNSAEDEESSGISGVEVASGSALSSDEVEESSDDGSSSGSGSGSEKGAAARERQRQKRWEQCIRQAASLHSQAALLSDDEHSSLVSTSDESGVEGLTHAVLGGFRHRPQQQLDDLLKHTKNMAGSAADAEYERNAQQVQGLLQLTEKWSPEQRLIFLLRGTELTRYYRDDLHPLQLKKAKASEMKGMPRELYFRPGPDFEVPEGLLEPVGDEKQEAAGEKKEKEDGGDETSDGGSESGSGGDSSAEDSSVSGSPGGSDSDDGGHSGGDDSTQEWSEDTKSRGTHSRSSRSHANSKSGSRGWRRAGGGGRSAEAGATEDVSLDLNCEEIAFALWGGEVIVSPPEMRNLVFAHAFSLAQISHVTLGKQSYTFASACRHAEQLEDEQCFSLVLRPLPVPLAELRRVRDGGSPRRPPAISTAPASPTSAQQPATHGSEWDDRADRWSGGIHGSPGLSATPQLHSLLASQGKRGSFTMSSAHSQTELRSTPAGPGGVEGGAAGGAGQSEAGSDAGSGSSESDDSAASGSGSDSSDLSSGDDDDSDNDAAPDSPVSQLALPDVQTADSQWQAAAQYSGDPLDYFGVLSDAAVVAPTSTDWVGGDELERPWFRSHRSRADWCSEQELTLDFCAPSRYRRDIFLSCLLAVRRDLGLVKKDGETWDYDPDLVEQSDSEEEDESSDLSTESTSDDEDGYRDSSSDDTGSDFNAGSSDGVSQPSSPGLSGESSGSEEAGASSGSDEVVCVDKTGSDTDSGDDLASAAGGSSDSGDAGEGSSGCGSGDDGHSATPSEHGEVSVDGSAPDGSDSNDADGSADGDAPKCDAASQGVSTDGGADASTASSSPSDRSSDQHADAATPSDGETTASDSDSAVYTPAASHQTPAPTLSDPATSDRSRGSQTHPATSEPRGTVSVAVAAAAGVGGTAVRTPLPSDPEKTGKQTPVSRGNHSTAAANRPSAVRIATTTGAAVSPRQDTQPLASGPSASVYQSLYRQLQTAGNVQPEALQSVEGASPAPHAVRVLLGELPPPPSFPLAPSVPLSPSRGSTQPSVQVTATPQASPPGSSNPPSSGPGIIKGGADLRMHFSSLPDQLQSLRARKAMARVQRGITRGVSLSAAGQPTAGGGTAGGGGPLSAAGGEGTGAQGVLGTERKDPGHRLTHRSLLSPATDSPSVTTTIVSPSAGGPEGPPISSLSVSEMHTRFPLGGGPRSPASSGPQGSLLSPDASPPRPRVRRGAAQAAERLRRVRLRRQDAWLQTGEPAAAPVGGGEQSPPHPAAGQTSMQEQAKMLLSPQGGELLPSAGVKRPGTSAEPGRRPSGPSPQQGPSPQRSLARRPASSSASPTVLSADDPVNRSLLRHFFTPHRPSRPSVVGRRVAWFEALSRVGVRSPPSRPVPLAGSYRPGEPTTNTSTNTATLPPDSHDARTTPLVAPSETAVMIARARAADARPHATSGKVSLLASSPSQSQQPGTRVEQSGAIADDSGVVVISPDKPGRYRYRRTPRPL